MKALCSEYAVEPRAIRSYRDFRYVFEKFGFSQGRLIVRVPTEWGSAVVAACSDPIDKLRVQERLKLFESSRSVPAPLLGGERPTTWIGHVSAVHKRQTLAGAIVGSETPVDDPLPPTISLDDCDEEFLPEVREDQVRRTAEHISEVGRALFRHSAKVAIVDPYFDLSSSKCRESLKKLIAVARQEGCDHLDIIGPDRRLNRETAAQELAIQIRKIFDAGKKRPILRFVFLPESSQRANFHHRFLLSTVGAIRLDAGVAAEGEDKWTDVILVARVRHEELVKQYLQDINNETNAFVWRWPQEDNGYRLPGSSRR
jgi:hypothetical protein